MQKHLKLALTVVLVMAVVPVAHADILNFEASIDGAQAGACAGSGSPATGTGNFTLDTVTGQVDYNITFDVGSLLGPETAAHVHGAAPECINAGVIYGLPAGSPKVGSVVLTAPQIADMIAGLHYVNIHSTIAPGGELRGQITQVATAVPSMAEWTMILTALLLLVVGTRWMVRQRASA